MDLICYSDEVLILKSLTECVGDLHPQVQKMGMDFVIQHLKQRIFSFDRQTQLLFFVELLKSFREIKPGLVKRVVGFLFDSEGLENK